MMSLIFRIDEEKSIELLGRDEKNFRKFIDTVCDNAGMDKIGDDEYVVRPEYDEDIVIGGLVLAWKEKRDLFESLSEWYWTDDSLDEDDDERCLDLIKNTYELISEYGESVIWDAENP